MIIDAFLFFNEFHLLDIRLHELNPVVDKFVILEATETFSGNPKPAYLNDEYAKHELAEEFRGKVYLYLLQSFPSFKENALWEREWFSRKCLSSLIKRIAKPDDTVIISDCDEIPRASIVTNWHELNTIEHDLFYYNAETYMGKWKGAVIGPWHEIEAAGGPQAVRDKNNQYPIIENGGWHFSYFGSPDDIRLKMQSFAHANDEPIQDICSRSNETIAADIAAGRDLLRRPEMVARTYEGTLPEYMVKNDLQRL